jgi:Protein of unknown function (DUF1549)/Protein of unknown function (DUF1553)
MRNIIVLSLLLPVVLQAAPIPVAKKTKPETSKIDYSKPYETAKPFKVINHIDKLALADWERNKIPVGKMCSDAVFLRRVYIDLIGTMPKYRETVAFLKSTYPQKRRKLIEDLLNRDDFADYWSLKWCDILRVKSEFPINLWPNAVQAYHHWVREAVRTNMPYDQFARELLTSVGSNFRTPQVNFYRAVSNRKPQGIASAAALIFMGTRLEFWPAEQREEIEKFFSRLNYKKTAEWKEEIVSVDQEPVETMKVKMPDGSIVVVKPDQDPRVIFANWLITPENRWFARAAVNRVWFWFFNRGIIHEPDDIRFVKMKPGSFWDKVLFKSPEYDERYPNNAPANPELLKYLEYEFIRSGYDFKKLCSLIVNSATYQQSFIRHDKNPLAEKHFAVYQVKRLHAEVLIDALLFFSKSHEKYTSVIPEPFTFVPPKHRTIALADGSISSSFLENFGRPARDSGKLTERNSQVTYAQRLFMLNSTFIQRKLLNTPLMRPLARISVNDPKKVITNTYLMLLSRKPTSEELKVLLKRYPSAKPPPWVMRMKNRKWRDMHIKKINRARAIKNYYVNQELVWALVNTKEFLFQH